VLDLIQANGISRPAIISSYNTPVSQEVVLGILVSKVVLYGQDNKQRNGLAEGINSLDYYCLYTVTRLG
jgi:hypothetical protein